MHLDRRRGFTLIELLVALILLIIVGGGLYQVLITVQRVSLKQTEVSNLHGNLRAGMQLIQSELQEIATNNGAGALSTDTDITAMTQTLLTYNAMRGVGETCEVPSTTAVKVRKSSYAGRAPIANRDALRLYTDADTAQVADDTWPPYPILQVDGDVCPDGEAAWALTIATIPVLANVSVPGPIRTYETMQIGLVNDAGQDWLGIRSISGAEAALVPVVGPLTSTGLRFDYFAGDGSAAVLTSDVKAIRITLRGITDRTVSTGLGSALGNPSDSLKFQVQLRNSR